MASLEEVGIYFWHSLRNLTKFKTGKEFTLCVKLNYDPRDHLRPINRHLRKKGVTFLPFPPPLSSTLSSASLLPPLLPLLLSILQTFDQNLVVCMDGRTNQWVDYIMLGYPQQAQAGPSGTASLS